MISRFIRVFSVSFFFVLISSCEENVIVYKGFSSRTDSLLRDTTPQSIIVDSLRQEILNASNDTDRVRYLGELSSYLRGSGARLIADEAKVIAVRTGNKYGIADAEMRIAHSLSRETKYTLADSVLSIAEQLAQDGKYYYLLSRIQVMRGDILRFQGNNVAAVPHVKSGIALARERGYEDMLALGNSSLGDIYLGLHRYDSARYCVNRVIEYGISFNDKNRTALGYSLLSVICRFESKLDSALIYIDKSLTISRELRDSYRLSSVFGTKGELYRMQNDNEKALMYFDSASVYAEAIKNKNQLAYIYGNMGSVYRVLNEHDRALRYYLSALSIAKEVNNKTLMASNLSTIGEVYRKLNRDDTALIYLQEALEITLATKDLNRQGFIYVAIGEIYRDSGLYEKSLDYLRKGDSAATRTSYENLKAMTWTAMARTYYSMKRNSEAETYALKGYDAALRTGIPNNIQESAKILHEVYESTGDDKKALEFYKVFVQARDSVNNESSVRRFAQVEYQAKENRLKAENAEQLAQAKAEELIKEEQLRKNRTILLIALSGIVLMIVLLVVIVRSLRQTKRARLLIEKQKEIVEKAKLLVDEKNKSIQDSITYARHLQEAIIPDEASIRESFPALLMLYLPKDIVAGDFVWYEKTQAYTFLAVADCTGHGVPGALVSVVCSNALNRCVNEFQLSDPGEILNQARVLVMETFRKSHQDVQDGMDISLAVFDNINRKKILWAGAHNPLIIVRNQEMRVYNADRQPVGKWENEKPFTTHEIIAESGDRIFLYTDGYADQFGGKEGKKLKEKKLRSLILESSVRTVEEQKLILRSYFDEWMGAHEQVDDVTILAVEV